MRAARTIGAGAFALAMAFDVSPSRSFAAGGASVLPTLAPSERRAIDRDCADRDARSSASDSPRFARIFDASRAHPTWRVADARALARIERDPDIYSELATVWRDGGHVATVAVAIRSLDFRAETTYCFRPSGALARIDETSSGTTNLDRERLYFDRRGRIVARLFTLAPLYPRAHVTLSPDVSPAMPDVYRTVRALPFFALL